MAAKKKLNHITERLGLTPMSRKPTFKEYAERRAVLTRKIESGKLNGIMLQRAKEYVASIDHRVRKKRGEPIKHRSPNGMNAKVRKAQAKLKAQLEAGQMQLPGFLKQMDVVRIEELVADKLAKMLADKIQLPVSKRKAS